MSETTVSALHKTSRNTDGFVVRSSDVIDEDINELKLQGYTLTEQTEDGYTVFIFTGEPAEEGDSSASGGVVVEAEEGSSSDTDAPMFKGQDDVHPCVWKSSTIATPEDDEAQGQKTFFVPDTGDQEVVVEVVIEHASDRNYSAHTGLCLKVSQASFGVLNSVNEKDHRGHFVNRLVVSASPTEKWRTKVDHVKIEPSDASNVDTFTKQKVTTLSVGANIDYKNLVQLGYSTAGGTTTGNIFTHGWIAKRDFKTKCVTWTWELKYWKDGQPFSSSEPGKFTFQRIPDLPFADLEHVALNKFAVEAEWKVPKTQLEEIEEIEWDINIKFYTTSIQRKGLFGFKKRRLGGHQFRVCNELPALISKITEKLTL